MPNKIESPDGYSWCGRCREHKELCDFSRSSSRTTGVNSYCKECAASYGKEYARVNHIRVKRNAWSLRRKYRQIAFSHYSGSPPRCQCAACPNPQVDPIFLDIDHIDGLSTEERDYVKTHGYRKRSGKALWGWLIENNFPAGFQVLCVSCNQGKSRNRGICPHLQNVRPNFEIIRPEEELTWNQKEIVC